MKRTINFFAAAVLVFGATAAFGASKQTSNSDNIQAAVTTNCTIGAFVLNFGTYDPTDTAPDTASSQITVRCTKGTSNVNVTMDDGVNTGRQMKNTANADLLNYEIYSDAANTIWPAAGVSLDFTSAVTVQLDVYGAIPPHEVASAGDYRDTVRATVNY